MEAFYIVGGVLAAWAVLVSFLGITRSDFPGSATAERAVALISFVLVLGAVGAAIVGAINESGHQEDDGAEHEAALVLPR
ncbi:MAG TPA: hypothetical protein VEX36_02065 [Thermoleophilaceae bacterium]|nr:hypothetical protein [Thermoleophilaceae bacterium]